MIIGIVSQKGGVGKSTLCRLLAREFISSGMTAKIADMDVNQSTCYDWMTERNKAELEPYVPVQQYSRIQQALAEADSVEVLIIDGAPNADKNTMAIAKAADLVIVPTGITLDDRRPAIRLIRELVAKGIPKEKISLALCRVTGTAKSTVAHAYHELLTEGYSVLTGAMRFQAAYSRAFDEGKAATETSYKSLNEEAEAVAQCVVNKLTELRNERAA